MTAAEEAAGPFGGTADPDDAAPNWTAATAGELLLDDVRAFLGRFIAYPSEAAHDAHALWIVHSHLMKHWDATPRIAFLSPEPASGKSRALEVTEPLVPRPVLSVNTTPAYLFRKVSDEAGAPTILYDEIDTVFGPKAKDNEDIRGMLNAGYRKGATAGRCVVRGKIVETEELPAYCAVALAGLHDLPDTIMSRAVVVRMRKRKRGERIEPWRNRINRPEGERLRLQIEGWITALGKDPIGGEWPDLPVGVADRDAEVWEPLAAVAALAGGSWPARARAAALAHVNAADTKPPSLGVLLLADLRRCFTDAGADRLSTEELLGRLTALDESPWSDLRGKPLDARGLSTRLGKYGIGPKSIRDGDRVHRGYESADLADAWDRYLSLPSQESATAATPTTDQPSRSAVAGVAAPTGDRDNGQLTPCGHPVAARTTDTARCALCIVENVKAKLRAVEVCPTCGTELLPDGLCLTCAAGDPNAT